MCSDIAAPPGVPIWLPTNGLPNPSVVLGDPEAPAVINILECRSELDPSTTYTITDPNNHSVTINPSPQQDYALDYQLPAGSPAGTYNVEITSRYGTFNLSIQAIEDTNPHIYVHDAITDDTNPDPHHGIRVDYTNFAPDSKVTVGLYLDQGFEDGIADPHVILLDVWQIDVDNSGRYSEILAPDGTRAEAGYFLIGCALENCVVDDLSRNAAVPLVVRSLRFQDSETVLDAVACSAESSLYSIDLTVATSIVFNNETSSPVKLYWLDYSGQRQLWNPELAPNSYSSQITFVTHPWVVTDLSDQCLAVYLPASQPGIANIQE